MARQIFQNCDNGVTGFNGWNEPLGIKGRSRPLLLPDWLNQSAPLERVIRDDKHPVQVVDILAVQNTASWIVSRGDSRPFSIFVGVAVPAVTNIAIEQGHAAYPLRWIA